MGARPYRQPLRPGARGGARSRPRNRLRQRAPLDPPQIGGGDALPARPPHPLGQAVFRGGYAGEFGAADDMTAILYPALRSDSPLLVRTAGAGAFVAVAFVVTVALPLATYTTALALFGVAHVLSELSYVDRRFGARLGADKALRIGLPILVAVIARAAATLGL